jgi:succinoglycan biosynthesis protein ExoL
VTAPRAAVIAPTTSQPRYHRRVAALQDAGFEVTVYAFNRGYYTVNDFPDGVPLHHLGAMADGAYLQRVPRLVRAALIMRRRESRLPPCSLWYAFGLDNGLLASLFARHANLVYEVGDLRNPVANRGMAARVLWRLESYVIRRAALLVVTSPDFIHQHYSPLLGDREIRWVVMENRVPGATALRYPRPSYRPAGEPVRVGVIGLLRYEATLLPLIEWVAHRPDSHELHVHGDGPLTDRIREAAERWPNLHYHGPFRNPDDLAAIYEGIDVCYCVYDSRDRNVRLALPNKLYEAPYFGVPVVAADGTAFARRVAELGVGVSIDPWKPDYAHGLNGVLAKSRVDDLRRRTLRVPTNMLVECPEIQVFRSFATEAGGLPERDMTEDPAR